MTMESLPGAIAVSELRLECATFEHAVGTGPWGAGAWSVDYTAALQLTCVGKQDLVMGVCVV